MNTRPAAPVEGLETVARQWRWGGDPKWKAFGPIFEDEPKETRELVTRSQSEAIIVAKDRLLAASDTVAQQLQNQIVTLTLKKEDLEADNAALTARVKELEESSKKSGVCITCLTGSPEPYGCSDCLNTGWDGGCPPNSPEDIKMLFAGMISDFSKIKSRAEALETKLAAARKALQKIAGDTYDDSAEKIARAALEAKP
ncbi:hypothetical protein CQZ93_06000 [Ochrobactrum vermis]|nr:hypothetical protein CQZ93_06000 [Ochrobactrum vermis]